MLNFVLCDDNANILNKLESMFNTLFLKHDYDAKIGLTSDNADEVLNALKPYII